MTLWLGEGFLKAVRQLFFFFFFLEPRGLQITHLCPLEASEDGGGEGWSVEPLAHACGWGSDLTHGTLTSLQAHNVNVGA